MYCLQMVKLKLTGSEGGLEDLVADLAEPVAEHEFRIDIDRSKYDYKEYGSVILKDLKTFLDSPECPSHWRLEEEKHEGWRVSVDEGEGKRGWFLLRQV